MKVVVTGARGMLGCDVVERMRMCGHETVALARGDLDITDAEAVVTTFDAIAPDVVVNCAAFTAVDRCETEPALAFAHNATAASNVAQACAKVDAHLVQISTDYVFDGTKPEPYVEADATNPMSVYGASKLAGEIEVIDALGDAATIVRTSWVCGLHGHNMVKTVAGLCSGDAELRFVDDQRGCPTFADDLAAAIERLALARVGGIVHVTNQGAVSWYEFVAEMLPLFGADSSRLVPIRTDDMQPPRLAIRPANSVLENRALVANGFELLDNFRVPLARLIGQLRARH